MNNHNHPTFVSLSSDNVFIGMLPWGGALNWRVKYASKIQGQYLCSMVKPFFQAEALTDDALILKNPIGSLAVLPLHLDRWEGLDLLWTWYRPADSALRAAGASLRSTLSPSRHVGDNVLGAAGSSGRLRSVWQNRHLESQEWILSPATRGRGGESRGGSSCSLSGKRLCVSRSVGRRQLEDVPMFTWVVAERDVGYICIHVCINLYTQVWSSPCEGQVGYPSLHSNARDCILENLSKLKQFR